MELMGNEGVPPNPNRDNEAQTFNPVFMAVSMVPTSHVAFKGPNKMYAYIRLGVYSLAAFQAFRIKDSVLGYGFSGAALLSLKNSL